MLCFQDKTTLSLYHIIIKSYIICFEALLKTNCQPLTFWISANMELTFKEFNCIYASRS